MSDPEREPLACRLLLPHHLRHLHERPERAQRLRRRRRRLLPPRAHLHRPPHLPITDGRLLRPAEPGLRELPTGPAVARLLSARLLSALAHTAASDCPGPPAVKSLAECLRPLPPPAAAAAAADLFQSTAQLLRVLVWIDTFAQNT